MTHSARMGLSFLFLCTCQFYAFGVVGNVRAQPLREICDRPNFSFQMFSFYQRLDVNEDGKVDFLIGTQGSVIKDYDNDGNWLRSHMTSYYLILPCGANMVRGNLAGVHLVEPGEPVDADTKNAGSWYDGGPLHLLGHGGWSDGSEQHWFGPLLDRSCGYIAFRLRGNGEQRSGWIRITVDKDAELSDEPVMADDFFVQTPGGPVPIVPQP